MCLKGQECTFYATESINDGRNSFFSFFLFLMSIYLYNSTYLLPELSGQLLDLHVHGLLHNIS